MTWHFFDSKFPKEILQADSDELSRFLSGPTLIHIQGETPECFLVSCLLHGNETTGWLAVRELLKEISIKPQQHSWLILIGNVAAAAKNLRQLPDGQDFNRVWQVGDLPVNRIAVEILNRIKTYPIKCSIDIHNNTGRNPYYACVTKRDERTLDLAREFAKQSLYFEGLAGTFTDAMSQMCPAISIEVGLPGLMDGVEAVRQYLQRVDVKVFALNWNPQIPADLEIYSIAGTIRIVDGVVISIDEGQDVDFRLSQDLDLYNFTVVPKGSVWAEACSTKVRCFSIDDRGNELEGYFEHVDGKIVNTCPIMPAMITPNTAIMKSDCVGYLLSRLDRV